MLNIKKSCWLALLFICSVFLPLNGQQAADSDQDLSDRIKEEIRNVQDFFSLICAKEHASDELRWLAVDACGEVFTKEASISLSLLESSAKHFRTINILQDQYISGGATPIITDVEVIDPLLVSELRESVSTGGEKESFGDIEVVLDVCFIQAFNSSENPPSQHDRFKCGNKKKLRAQIRVVVHKTYSVKGEFLITKFHHISLIEMTN